VVAADLQPLTTLNRYSPAQFKDFQVFQVFLTLGEGAGAAPFDMDQFTGDVAAQKVHYHGP
jgi:hypothetical protein